MNDDDSFKVELFFGESRRFEFPKNSVMIKRVNGEVSVDKGVLASMPFNDAFFIICSAKFTNKAKE